MKEYNIYILDKYIIHYDNSIIPEFFSEKSYYGIIFYINDGRYELIHNFHLGNRILINEKSGWQDIPFKKETFGFLPPGVRAEEIDVYST